MPHIHLSSSILTLHQSQHVTWLLTILFSKSFQEKPSVWHDLPFFTSRTESLSPLKTVNGFLSYRFLTFFAFMSVCFADTSMTLITEQRWARTLLSAEFLLLNIAGKLLLRHGQFSSSDSQRTFKKAKKGFNGSSLTKVGVLMRSNFVRKYIVLCNVMQSRTVG